MGDVDVSEMYVQTVRNRRVQIELVGGEMIQAQQKQIQQLLSARIVGAAVSYLVSYVGESMSGIGRGTHTPMWAAGSAEASTCLCCCCHLDREAMGSWVPLLPPVPAAALSCCRCCCGPVDSAQHPGQLGIPSLVGLPNPCLRA